MKIHEYQAKELFGNYGITVPEGRMALTAEEAVAVAASFNSFPVAVKAQIHAGGRGKGGGVKLAQSLDEVRTYAGKMLGMNLVTRQTGPEGREVKTLLVEKGLPIRQELYLSMVPDRESAQLIIMASLAGGMDIEEVAAETPGKIVKVGINPLLGIQPYHLRQLIFGLDLEPAVRRSFSELVGSLFKLFMDMDCALVEINPLVITDDDKVVALDAKINFDDNGLFRHDELLPFRDLNEEAPQEVEASKYGLNYIALNGTIGNMVNGAGLAMATMDLIKQAGAEPANFLDVGGGADASMVENGFRIILSDKKVRGILINIFGGILRCDVLAEGVVQAARKTDVKVPVVVRMEGTNVEKGRQILADSGLNIITAVDLQDAAAKIAAIA